MQGLVYEPAIVLCASHLPDIISAYYTVAMFAVATVWTFLCTELVGMFVIYVLTSFSNHHRHPKAEDGLWSSLDRHVVAHMVHTYDNQRTTVCRRLWKQRFVPR